MYQYLEGLVQQRDIAFPPELLKPMYDLYLDMMAYYLPEDPQQRRHGNNNIHKLIVESQLMSEMKNGIGALGNDPEVSEIVKRLNDAGSAIMRHKEASAPGAPGYGGEMKMY